MFLLLRYEMTLLVELLWTYQVLSPIDIVTPWLYILVSPGGGGENRSVGGRSSETWSHPIDIHKPQKTSC
jgi:hypothetical protein